MTEVTHFMILPEPEHFMFMPPSACRMMEPWPLDGSRMPWDPRTAPASVDLPEILRELWDSHNCAMEWASMYEAKLEHGTKEDAENAKNMMDMHEQRFGELMIHLNAELNENLRKDPK